MKQIWVLISMLYTICSVSGHKKCILFLTETQNRWILNDTFLTITSVIFGLESWLTPHFKPIFKIYTKAETPEGLEDQKSFMKNSSQ